LTAGPRQPSIGIMETVTIKLVETVARWVRDRATKQEKSVSRFVEEVLEREMVEDTGYEEAMERFLARRPARISESGAYPSREELHDQAGLR
jgi:hypothetical protein